MIRIQTCSLKLCPSAFGSGDLQRPLPPPSIPPLGGELLSAAHNSLPCRRPSDPETSLIPGDNWLFRQRRTGSVWGRLCAARAHSGPSAPLKKKRDQLQLLLQPEGADRIPTRRIAEPPDRGHTDKGWATLRGGVTLKGGVTMTRGVTPRGGVSLCGRNRQKGVALRGSGTH